jgi:hypothetical protein
MFRLILSNKKLILDFGYCKILQWEKSGDLKTKQQFASVNAIAELANRSCIHKDNLREKVATNEFVEFDEPLNQI